MKRREGRQLGFTLVELLVAIAIMLVMLALVNQIFSNMSKLVGQGMGLSHVLADAGAMQDQLRRDAELMLGPDRQLTNPPKEWIPPRQGGVLIIINRLIRGPRGSAAGEDADGDGVPVSLPDGKGVTRRRIGVDKDKDGKDDPYMVRSDQLVFIRARGNEDPLAPSGTNNYTGEHLTDDDCQFIRVWYGHVRRTSPLGDNDDDPDFVDDPNEPGALGQPADTITEGDQTYVIDNELASDWILGRQAMFLSEQAPGGVHANGGWVNAPVVGYGAANGTLYMALTDVAYFGYTTNTTRGCMVGGSEELYPTGAVADGAGINEYYRRLWSNYSNARDIGLGGGFLIRREYPRYQEDALFYYTYARKRLRVNPTPDYYVQDPANPGATAGDRRYEAWQIAQTHPYFMTGVSDFIVEFAADIIDDPGIEAVPGIPWPDGEPDRVLPNPAPYPAASSDANGIDYIHPGGDLRWYSAYETNDPADTTPTTKIGDSRRYFVNEPSHFNPNELPDFVPPFRLPIHLTSPSLLTYTPMFTPAAGTPEMPHVDAAFVFRHDDDGVNLNHGGTADPECIWPYLIRIRWRMHDAQNRLWDSEDGHTGKWFEQIIPVSRPR